MRLFIFCAISAVGVAPGVYAQQNDVECPPVLERAKRYIESSVKRGLAPGVSVVVVKNDAVIWAEGFGYADIEKNYAAHSDTIYLLASVSKPLTATGLMKLVDKGDVDIDRPVNDYLPSTKLRAFRGSADDITIRRFGNHTGGLPTHYTFFYDGVARPSMDESIRRFGYAVYEPGTRTNYSNLAFGILDYVTEVVSGTPWSAYMEREVYDPLGMMGTSDHVRAERIEDRAQIYTRNVAGDPVPVGAYDFDHRGASAVWSSAHDLARFCRMHLHEGELDGVRVLSSASARVMQTRSTPDSSYGFAWNVGTVDGPRKFSHSGGMPGVSTLVTAWPDENLVMVCLTNGDGHSIVGGVQKRVYRELVGKQASRALTLPGSQDGDGAKFEGKWEGRIAHFDGDIPLTVTVEDGEVAHVKFGERTRIAVDSPDIGDTLRFQSRGLIPVNASFHGVSDLAFALEREGDRLLGTLFASAQGYYGVSFWVELQRMPAE